MYTREKPIIQTPEQIATEAALKQYFIEKHAKQSTSKARASAPLVRAVSLEEYNRLAEAHNARIATQNMTSEHDLALVGTSSMPNLKVGPRYG